MTIRTLKSKVVKMQELQAEIDKLKAQEESIKDAIKAEMTQQNVDELEVGANIISWKLRQSKRIDTSKLKSELPDLAEKYSAITESRPFCILINKKKAHA